MSLSTIQFKTLASRRVPSIASKAPTPPVTTAHKLDMFAWIGNIFQNVTKYFYAYTSRHDADGSRQYSVTGEHHLRLALPSEQTVGEADHTPRKRG